MMRCDVDITLIFVDITLIFVDITLIFVDIMLIFVDILLIFVFKFEKSVAIPYFIVLYFIFGVFSFAFMTSTDTHLLVFDDRPCVTGF